MPCFWNVTAPKIEKDIAFHSRPGFFWHTVYTWFSFLRLAVAVLSHIHTALAKLN